jgi:hypothetical protein
MELITALQLIERAVPLRKSAQQWMDLGAGKGLFASVLSDLLPKDSLIIAVDKINHTFQYPINEKIRLRQLTSDFINDPLPGNNDGLLMANALHFVQDKEAFVRKIKKSIREDAALILIEYDTDRASQWVPFPVSFKSLVKLCSHLDGQAEQIGHASSVYQPSGIYIRP